MKKFRLLTLVLALTVGLMTAAGCAKKNVDADLNAQNGGLAGVNGSGTSMTPIEVAAEAISDGIIYFDYNKYDIRAEYRDILAQKAELMRQYPSIRVRIEGNCDDRGTQEYNLALGERRARAAYEYMIMLGVNPSQIDIISYGKERPVVSGSGEEAWSMNRRDDFRVLSK